MTTLMRLTCPSRTSSSGCFVSCLLSCAIKLCLYVCSQRASTARCAYLCIQDASFTPHCYSLQVNVKLRFANGVDNWAACDVGLLSLDGVYLSRHVTVY
jgi:hypothetical protein